MARRGPDGGPRVVVCHPLVRRGASIEPFPTTLWLTDPDLCARLSHLERDGLISRVALRIAADADLRQSLAADHERYIALRRSLLSDEDRRAVEASDALNRALARRGIGGVEDHTQVKCLHAHYAQHLVDGNTVGRLVDATAGEM